MTKMSKAQRTVTLAAHNNPGTSATGAPPFWGRGYLGGPARTRQVMRREGWADVAGIAVTTAGLIAAGVDMDAIHAEAITADRQRTAAFRQDPWAASGSISAIEARRAALNDKISRDHAEALADDVVWEARRIVPDPRDLTVEDIRSYRAAIGARPASEVQ